MWVGIAISLGFLLFLPDGSPLAVIGVAARNDKFSFGDPARDFTRPTIPVAVLYGTFWYLQRYVADQTLVQRYLLAKSDRGALRGVSIGAFLCVPVWALFMLIGTCVWAYFKSHTRASGSGHHKIGSMFSHFLA